MSSLVEDVTPNDVNQPAENLSIQHELIFKEALSVLSEQGKLERGLEASAARNMKKAIVFLAESN